MKIRWKRHPRLLQAILVTCMVFATVGSALAAWQTSVSGFEHNSRYGGEAESGNRTGSVEYAGVERRIRVGAEYIRYTQAQIDWNKNNYYPAFVFHVAPKNDVGGACTAMRTVSGWNWSNLPGASISSKGCGGPGYNGNEIRFYYDASQARITTTYYAQSLYKDTGYNGTQASKATGQMNYDSYAADWLGVRKFNDFHGKICIDPDTTYKANALNRC